MMEDRKRCSPTFSMWSMWIASAPKRVLYGNTELVDVLIETDPEWYKLCLVWSSTAKESALGRTKSSWLFRPGSDTLSPRTLLAAPYRLVHPDALWENLFWYQPDSQSTFYMLSGVAQDAGSQEEGLEQTPPCSPHLWLERNPCLQERLSLWGLYCPLGTWSWSPT